MNDQREVRRRSVGVTGPDRGSGGRSDQDDDGGVRRDVSSRTPRTRVSEVERLNSGRLGTSGPGKGRGKENNDVDTSRSSRWVLSTQSESVPTPDTRGHTERGVKGGRGRRKRTLERGIMSHTGILGSHIQETYFFLFDDPSLLSFPPLLP